MSGQMLEDMRNMALIEKRLLYMLLLPMTGQMGVLAKSIIFVGVGLPPTYC